MTFLEELLGLKYHNETERIEEFAEELAEKLDAIAAELKSHKECACVFCRAVEEVLSHG